MALSDYQPERREISVNGKPLFFVEGFSFESLEKLARTHMPDLESIFDLVLVGDTPVTTLNASIGAMAIALVQKAPGLTANIIALSTGEPVTEDLINTARKLPFPVQIDALVKIGEITFEENGGVKKSMDSLLDLLAKIRAVGPVVTPTKGKREKKKPLFSAVIGASDGT
jgi:hypothetical protein